MNFSFATYLLQTAVCLYTIANMEYQSNVFYRELLS